MKVAIISSSLRKGSFSKIMAERALECLKAKEVEAEFIDLTEVELPFCDGGAIYGDERVQAASKQLQSADRILVATPIYNFSINSALKNYLELTGRDAWSDKFVGFLCAAGGGMSYMSVMSFANSLMLDFRCIIIPRFVYAQSGSFEGGALKDEEVEKRIEGLCDLITKIRID